MSGAVFLKLEGIDGEATDADHEGEIDVLGWSWGLAQTGGTELGGGMTRGRVTATEMQITKYMDKSSSTLIKHVCNGAAIPTAVLTVQKSGGEDKVQALQIEMKGVLITSFTPSGSGDPGNEIPVENLSLACKEFMYKYTGQKADSTGDATAEQGWNLEKNVPA